MAGFIRKIFGHFGGKKEDHSRKQPQAQGQWQGQPVQRPEATAPGGFGVKVAVPVEPAVRTPVVSQCTYGNGGVQVLLQRRPSVIIVQPRLSVF